METTQNTAPKIGLSFGFSAVNAGQRNVNEAPVLVVSSTEGAFRISAAVSKALNISHGEYVSFLSNADQIDQAIANREEGVVAFCEANGLDINADATKTILHSEFGQWGITKGIVEFDAKGFPKTQRPRLSKNDKVKLVSVNFAEALASALESNDEDVKPELKEDLNREGITKEEQIDLLASIIEADEEPKYMGSKSANSSAAIGSGVTLTFTDTNVWKQLKADMGENDTKLNRIFELDVDNIIDVELFDGFKSVPTKALILGASSDKEPIVVGKKAQKQNEAKANEATEAKPKGKKASTAEATAEEEVAG